MTVNSEFAPEDTDKPSGETGATPGFGEPIFLRKNERLDCSLGKETGEDASPVKKAETEMFSSPSPPNRSRRDSPSCLI